MKNIILFILYFVMICDVYCSKDKLDITEFTEKTEFKSTFFDDFFPVSEDAIETFFCPTIKIVSDNGFFTPDLDPEIFDFDKQEREKKFSEPYPLIDIEKEDPLNKAHIELLVPGDYLIGFEQKNNIQEKRSDLTNKKRKKRDKKIKSNQPTQTKNNNKRKKSDVPENSKISNELYKKITLFSFKNISLSKDKEELLNHIQGEKIKDGTIYANFCQIKQVLRILFLIKDDNSLDKKAVKNCQSSDRSETKIFLKKKL